ncbi:MAG TPA: hypothetical protein VFL71_22075 [Actinomycetes bacterium]|nr:hypothetical protein [Actinomycetes bacterium]
MMRAPRLSRTILWLLTVPLVVTGAWALGAPESFYQEFPGGGRTWVSALPPYNEHLIRDVGSLSLALAVLTAAAALTLERRLVIVTALALLVWSTPHLAFHLGHLEGLATVDQVGQLVTLGLGVALPLVLLGLAAARPRPATPREPVT